MVGLTPRGFPLWARPELNCLRLRLALVCIKFETMKGTVFFVCFNQTTDADSIREDTGLI